MTIYDVCFSESASYDVAQLIGKKRANLVVNEKDLSEICKLLDNKKVSFKIEPEFVKTFKLEKSPDSSTLENKCELLCAKINNFGMIFSATKSDYNIDKRRDYPSYPVFVPYYNIGKPFDNKPTCYVLPAQIDNSPQLRLMLNFLYNFTGKFEENGNAIIQPCIEFRAPIEIGQLFPNNSRALMTRITENNEFVFLNSPRQELGNIYVGGKEISIPLKILVSLKLAIMTHASNDWERR